MTARAKGEQPARRRPGAQKTTRDPDVVFVDFNDLTASDFEAIEELSGLPIARTADVTKPQGAIGRAMGWVVRVRTDPHMPFEGDDCDRGQRPRCAECICSRRLKVFIVQSASPVPPSGENA